MLGTDPRRTYGAARGLRAAVASRVSARCREQRIDLFVELAGVRPGARVLDAGSGRRGLLEVRPDLDVTAVSRDAVGEWGGPAHAYVRGDLRDLPFCDDAFDVVYCNSALEHVAPEHRLDVAREIRRVGRRYFVQTPNKFFPVEPHALLPMVQFLPEDLQRRAWRFGVSRDPYEPIHLLTLEELRVLFPDGEVRRERWGGLTKSLLAVGPRG